MAIQRQKDTYDTLAEDIFQGFSPFYPNAIAAGTGHAEPWHASGIAWAPALVVSSHSRCQLLKLVSGGRIKSYCLYSSAI